MLQSLILPLFWLLCISTAVLAFVVGRWMYSDCTFPFVCIGVGVACYALAVYLIHDLEHRVWDESVMWSFCMIAFSLVAGMLVNIHMQERKRRESCHSGCGH